MVEELNLFDYNNEQEEESKLTSKHWALWRLIEHNSLVEHRKTSQREICNELAEYGFVYDESDKTHDHCSAIWTIVKDNNESLEHNKIIISKNFEYWIGNEEETNEYLKGLWKALAPRLSRYWNYYKKLKRHNQGKLLSNQLQPIDEDSRAEQFFNCFNEYNVSMQSEE